MDIYFETLRKTVERHAGDFILHANDKGLAAKDIYNLSLVKFYWFVDEAVKDQDEDFQEEILHVIGNAESKKDIEKIIREVSDIVEEYEIDNAPAENIEKEFHGLNAEYEEQREQAKFLAVAAYIHTPGAYA